MKYKAYYVRPQSIVVKDNKLISLLYNGREVKSLINGEKQLMECNSMYEAIGYQTKILQEIFPNIDFSIPAEHHENGKKFGEKVEKLADHLKEYGLFPTDEIRVSSGYRHLLYCAYIGGAMRGQHTTYEAVDIEDIGNKIDNWIDADYKKDRNKALITGYDVSLESSDVTNSWTHWQNRLPLSGNRIFKP